MRILLGQRDATTKLRASRLHKSLSRLTPFEILVMVTFRHAYQTRVTIIW